MGNFKMFNLCSEKTYEAKFFNIPDDMMENHPFNDHNPPELHQIIKFCESACEWLDKSEHNVITVNCKAGKGRTGTMICALLCYRYKISAQQAFIIYGEKRSKKIKGVTIPAQKQFVEYFEKLVVPSPEQKILGTGNTLTFNGFRTGIMQKAKTQGFLPGSQSLRLLSVTFSEVPHVSSSRKLQPYFTVQSNFWGDGLRMKAFEKGNQKRW